MHVHERIARGIQASDRRLSQAPCKQARRLAAHARSRTRLAASTNTLARIRSADIADMLYRTEQKRERAHTRSYAR